MILQSLHTEDRSAAEIKRETIWSNLIETWEARLRGDTDDAKLNYEAAVNMAEIKGKSYRLMTEVAQLKTSDLLERSEAIRSSPEASHRNTCHCGRNGFPSKQHLV